jgi:hypothetical protein
MNLNYQDMAALLSQLRLAGDVIPFRNRPQRGEVPGIPATGPMPGGRGGHGEVIARYPNILDRLGNQRPGTYGSRWRDPGQVREYEGSVGLRPGSIQPVAPRSADVVNMPYGGAMSGSPGQAVPGFARHNQATRQQADKDFLSNLMMGQGGYSKDAIRNFNKAYEQLTPSEKAKLMQQLYFGDD